MPEVERCCRLEGACQIVVVVNTVAKRSYLKQFGVMPSRGRNSEAFFAVISFTS